MGRTPRGIWIGPVHIGLNRHLRDYVYRDGRAVPWWHLRFDWFDEVNKPYGHGTGKACRLDTRFGSLRLQLGGPQPWRA